MKDAPTSDTSTSPSATSTKHAATSRNRRKRMRFGLLELLLLTTVVAAWLPVVLARRLIPKLQSEIETMRFSTSELIVTDEQKLTVRALPDIWSNIDSWKYHLPEGADLELRLATEFINSVSSPSDYQAVALPTGEHSIHFKHTSDADGYHSVVYLDAEAVLQKHHPKSWITTSGSSSTGSASNQSTSYELDQPPNLKVQRFSQSHPLIQYESMELPGEYDSKGNYLWISPASVVPSPAPIFYYSQDKHGHEGVGHRQGIKVFRSNHAGLVGVIGILPSLDSTLGDKRHFYPYCPLGVSVRPVVSDQSAPEAPEAKTNPSIGAPLSLRDSIDPPKEYDDSYARESITEASVDEDGQTMRVFAHYKPFESGAKPIVEILFDAAHPDRVGFLPRAAPDSVPMKACQFVTQFDARYLWREIEMIDDEADERSRRPLASLYPNIDFSEPPDLTAYDIAPFAWRRIATSKLPLAKLQEDGFEMAQLNLLTDVSNATALTYPAGLDQKWKYTGLPNRQVWWLPMLDSDDESEISVEVRGAAVFPTAQLLIPGGPAIQNVRITVPMPAKEPVWLEISAEPAPDAATPVN
ncbi:hypothetical protein [Aporhodopirellula aestuarii]|uniref:Uncharacterized protein n=1 Tax=Aporhodopirellula aestuarii TaxID=2950107 RepID=A0ABT0TWN1_9BACT|nr:hypothetical protein [Aporhodopirellula aestuarii]MCM2369029.1 hypothetical protein [Aporhodopirellula aestuarii]